MYKTNNLNLASFLLTATKAKILELRNNEVGGKTFVLSGTEAEYAPLILKYFNSEKFHVAPRELFQQVKALKGLLYDVG